MRLIFIYGPPAVGKTTVGEIVAKRTGYRFFFNHLTTLAAKALFPESSSLHGSIDGYHALLRQLRLDGIRAAVDAGLDVIFTVAYSGRVDDAFVGNVVEIVTSAGGEVDFVQLSAPDAVLMERVSNASRSDLHLGKMTSPEHLRVVLAARDMRASVPYPSILKIDTDELTALQAADRIITHFRLPSGK